MGVYYVKTSKPGEIYTTDHLYYTIYYRCIGVRKRSSNNFHIIGFRGPGSIEVNEVRLMIDVQVKRTA